MTTDPGVAAAQEAAESILKTYKMPRTEEALLTFLRMSFQMGRIYAATDFMKTVRRTTLSAPTA